MVSQIADKILYEIYRGKAKTPEVLFARRTISRFTSQDLFVYSDQDPDMTLLQAEKVLEHY